VLEAVQKQELSEALFSAFPVLGDFDLMLRTRVNQQRERMSPVAAMPDVIDAVVNTADHEFWIPNLISGAWQVRNGNPQLQAFIAKYPALDPTARPAPPVNHYDTTFFVARRVFLRRSEIRDLLKQLGGTNTRVLRVNGERGTGKTYSKDFVGYLLQFDPARRTERNRLEYVDLDKNGTDLQSVALRIGGALDLDPQTLPPRSSADKEQDSRWLPDLYAWLVQGIKGGAHDVWWLVLDGFVQTLPSEALDLIDMLGNFADVETTRLRLILLNYPRTNSLPFSFYEEIAKPVLEEEHVRQFVESVYTKSGKDAASSLITTTVKDILQQVQQELAKPPNQPHDELKILSLALTRAAQKLLR